MRVTVAAFELEDHALRFRRMPTTPEDAVDLGSTRERSRDLGFRGA